MTDGPGHYDADGAYVYGEADASTVGGRFSDLLNKGIQSIKQAARNIAVDTLSTDPAIIAAATDAVDEITPGRVEAALDGKVVPGAPIPDHAFGIMNEGEDPFVYFQELPESSGWAWQKRYIDDEIAMGQRLTGRMFPDALNGRLFRSLAICGDSIAEGWAPYGQLIEDTGKHEVDNRGIGGQRSEQIHGRIVGGFVTVAGNVLPASGTVNVTALTDASGAAISPLVLTFVGPRYLEVEIQGSRWRLAGQTVVADTPESVTYTLTRLKAGYEIPLTPGSPYHAAPDDRDHIPILLGPRNDLGLEGNWRRPLETIAPRYAAMLAYFRNGQDGIVLSVLPRADQDATGTANLALLNDTLRKAFPTQFYDWGAWLRSDAAFTVAGIAKTTDDATDIVNGFTPRSFRNPGDAMHLNQYGYRAATYFITEILKSKGLQK